MTGINERLTAAAREDLPGGLILRLRLWICRVLGHAWRRGYDRDSFYCLRCGLHDGWIEHGHRHPLVDAFWARTEEQICN